MTDTDDEATDRHLKQRLAAVTAITESLDPDSVAAVRRRMDQRRRRRWRRVALAAAAAAVLVGVVAVAVVEASPEDESLDVVAPSTVEEPSTSETSGPTSSIRPSTTTMPPTTAPEPDPQPPGGPPIPFQAFAALTWTGSEVLVDDAAAYEPESDTWRAIAPSPLPAEDATPVTAMTDLGVVVVRGTATALWDPATDSWRRLDDAPAPPLPEGGGTARVTDLAADGDQIISHTANAVLDVTSGTWTPLPDPPITLAGATTAWTGEELIVVGGPNTRFTSAAAMAVDPDGGGWRTLPQPPEELRAEALSASWDGQRIVVTNYDMTAATYEPGTGAWAMLPPVPARFSEWSPLTVSSAGTTITLMAQAFAVLGNDDRWEPYPYGLINAGPTIRLDGTGQVASWGADYESRTNTLSIVDLAALVETPRRQVGAGSVELGPGEEVTEAGFEDMNGLVQTVRLDIATRDGGSCTVSSTYLGAVGPAIDRPVREELPGADGPISWSRDEAGTIWETEATTSDLFQVSCDRPADARRLAGTTRFP